MTESTTSPLARAVGRVIATALLAALTGAAGTAVFYAWHPTLRMEFDRDPPRLVSGIYPAEHDERGTLTFAWTAGDVAVRLPGLDRHVDWTILLRVRGARPLVADNPDIAIFVDGLPVLTHHTAVDFEEVHATLPAHPERRRGAVITIHTSSTFVPGLSDRRALGVMLDRLILTPAGPVLPPPDALGGAALTSAFMGAAIAALGVTAGSAVGGAILLSFGIAAIVARGFGPLTLFPVTAMRLSLGIAIAVMALALGVHVVRRAPLRNTARFAGAFTASALCLKLLVLLHPDMPIGDALFHAHRFQAVLAGHLYFTSTAPGGYAFPYAPGLYLFASLFAGFVRRGLSDMALLRIIVCSADAVASLLLYRAIERVSKDRLAAAMAVALYQLVPLDFSVMTVGNLTNAFAQAVAVGAFVMMTSAGLRLEHRATTVAFAAVLAAAYLSHTSTLAILFVATLATAVCFRLRGGPALRSPAAAIVAASCAAAILAVLLYYGHFIQTYQSELGRLSRETAAAAPDAGGRSIGDRLAVIPYYLRTDFGVPMIVLTAIGAWYAIRRRVADRLSLTIAGWLLSCALFLVIGIVTPMDMRYYLAAIPAVAVLAAMGASYGWQAGPSWRSLSVVLLAGAALVGIRNWWGALG